MDNLPRSRNHRSILFAMILCLLLLNACVLPTLEGIFQSDDRISPWAVALRALDPADAATPAYDITAVYLHRDTRYLQIRIELLDFQSLSDLSLDIRIRDASAPEATPLDLHVPSESDAARISFGPLLDTVIVEIPLSEIPASPRVGVSTPEDQVSGLKPDGPVPTQTTPVLLTFYDTFAGRFPAEALRSWDGAHTGPRGERHGLKYLLDAVEQYRIPVVLLDLKRPENLSALDAMGLLPRIEALENQGLLIFPENNENDLQFVQLEDSTHLYKPLFRKTTYFPIVSETDANQPTPDGPSLEIRRALLEIALNADKKVLLVLGGSFQNSTWGSPDMVGATMAYFASRPYIHVLNAEDLSTFPTTIGNTITPQAEEPISEQTTQVQSALALAQNWANTTPAEMMAQCQPDFPECVLANDSYLAIFDANSGSLAYLFTRNQTDLHQLIGPSWQVAPGLDIYPGAFADSKDYEPAVSENLLVFKSSDETRIKTFTLNKFGLEVKYQTDETVTTQIPLLVDPDSRFTPGWAEKYVQEKTPGGIAWGLENGPMVSIQAEGLVTMRAFNESLFLLQSPEDPDFPYPPGHTIPFPMAVGEVEMKDGYFLRLERLP
jgi:hypothetical protein